MPVSLTVAFLPVYHNPYQHLLAKHLRVHGVETVFLKGLPSPQWLRTHRGRVQVLHYHWLSGLYLRGAATLPGLAAFLHRFHLARKLGYKIVWTAHNILPHKYPWLPIHAPIRRLFMRQAAAVIAHCEYGRAELLRRFPRNGPVYVVPHGSYRGVHPITESRSQARAALGIAPEQFVYLMAGNISPYKGVDRFWETFQRFAAPDDVALIAGRNRAPNLVRRLQNDPDPRLRLYPGFIDDEHMQRYLQAADVAVFAFEEILTSGSVILALSYGLPVITPALGCLPELVTPEAGWLYPPGDRTALGETLRRAKEADLSPMRATALRLTDALDWGPIAARTAEVYRHIIATPAQ